MVKSKWMLKKNVGPDGDVLSYKARLFAQGYNKKI